MNNTPAVTATATATATAMAGSACSNTSTPIAIVGMGCRFAGDATSPQKLWEMVERGGSAWSKVPSSRFNVRGVYHPNGERVGSTHVKGGHFIDEDPALFDAAFFNMTTEVASCMDPQYRLMLEVVYESLESAGITIDGMAGSNTSVFGGVMYHDYQDSLNRDPETVPRYFITGNSGTMLSNRISHFYDLRGPSVTVDTACSTTLTALHLACQSLRTGESDTAIVIGANLLLNPDVFVTMSNLGFLSPDGISYSFDPRANGYGRGEGIAALVIKALPNALRDQDPIRAVIRETALNQDGKTPAITAPSDVAQKSLIQECYDKAGLDMSLTSYVEAHGTGTPTGDPLEISAISAAFKGHPLHLGSVKANIGHTEAASGLASIIKVALALEKGLIPPNARFLQKNSKLMLDQKNIKIPMSAQDWPVKDGTRRASVNNFGFGGSNAHVILESYDRASLALPEDQVHVNGNSEHGRVEDGSKQSRIYVVRAKDEQACRRTIASLRDYIKSVADIDGEPFLASLAYTLGSRRSILPWTSVYVADSLGGLVSALSDESNQPKRANEKVRLGFVFTGQGAQWHAMGRELVNTFPVFKQAILECDGYIKQLGASWNFMEELHRDELTTRVNDAEYSLPLSTAIQIALVRLLWSWGIRPTGITSHSSGEAAAAYAAGALSARSAIGITYIRGVLTTKPKPALAAKGGMMAVGLGRSETNVYISRLNQEDGCVVVGCINSQCSVTVSGDLGAIEKLEKLLHADGIFTRKLKVTEAFHSSHMRPMADAFGASLRDLFNSDNNNDNPNADTSKGVLYSSPKTGSRMTDLKLLLDPTHWMDSMLQPVEFESSLREMCFDPNTKEKAVDVIIEIGPHGALGGPINQVMQDLGLKGTDINYLSCLSRGRSSLETMYRAATELISKGYGLKMDAINFPHGRKEPRVKVLSDLPAYPWNHQTRYWREPRGSRESKQRTHPPHTLIGSRESLSPHFAPKWKHVLRLSDIPWIRDHVVGSSIIFPGAGFISMAIEGFSQVCPPVAGASINYNLRDVELAQALIIPADAEAEVDLRLTIRSCEERSLGTKNWHQFSVHSISGENNTWTEHCTGLIRSESERSHLDCSTVEASRRLNLGSDNRSIDPNDLWESLHANGICHGPIFQNIQRIQNNGQGSFCRFSIADTASAMPHSYENRHIVHPTTLDSVIQAAYTVLPYAGTRMKTAMVPRRLRNVKISSSLADLEAGDALDAQASIKDRNSQSFSTDLAVFDDYDSGSSPSDGTPVIEIEGLVFQSVGSSFSDQKSDSNDTENACSSWVWAPDISLGDSTWLKEKLSTEAETKETELMMDLRRCTINFIQEAVTDLTNSDIQHLDGHLQKYFDWMNVQLDLARQNKLSPASCDWLSDDAEQKKCLQARVAGESVNGEMISRLGPQLIAMLRRETEPLELMMQDQLLSRYYVNAIKWSRSNAQASELIRLCAHKNPRSRILEIGGGTGGCTKLIVNALGNTKPIDRYDFTDVSAGFFESAREQFADWQDVMTFKKLDIESDPEQQGFECATYDVVVACQVLHATRCMKRTLSNVRKLLKPGGNLILVETTRDQLDLFFTFGLLPGWWLSEEPERKSTPSLTTDLWNTMLDTSGFNGVELEVRDCEDDEFYMISTMLSTARKENTTPDTVAESEVLLLHGALRPPSSWLESLQAAICEKTSSSPSINALGEVDTTGRTCIFLGEMESSLLGEVGSETFKSITAMLNNCNALLWVSRGAAMSSEDPWKALHIGLLRTIRNENNGKEYVSLDLDPSRNAYTHESLYAICNIFNGRLGDLSEDKEFEFAERNGVIHVPRLFNDPHWKDQEAVEVTLQPFEQPGRRLRMEVETPGLLDSLQFRDDEGREGKDLPDDWVEIEPKAFGLNFRDVMVAMGQLEANRVMGFECAGVITKLGGAAAASQGLRLGDRVCALLKGHWATRTQTPYTNVVRIPDEMGFPEAASVPLAFTTAYIALYTTAKLRRGERVLIHSGAGGVGQAAIILSQLAGAEVFVTAGTQAKRDFVGDKFGINPDHIFSSRNDLFVDGIKAYTGGLGVHVVLNSLAGQLLQASFDCMAEFGRFVEIGKKDLEQNSRLDMLPFTRDVSFTSIDLLSWQRAKSEEVSEALNHVTKLLETKAIGLIGPIQQHSLSNIEKAFRTMQSGQHVGKVVVNVSGDELVPVGDGGFSLKLKPDSSYLVAGGLGGIGKQICQWLVDHGAKHLIILSRSAKASPFITSLQNQQCAVYLHACDISDQDQVTKVLRLCEEAHAPPIRGIIQGAMVLKDALLSRMTLDEFNAATRPKVQGSWYLHKIAQDVDFFVMLSSLVGVMGGAGQANYAAAGAFQDALAHHRRAHGMPAVTIDLGMVKSVGYVAETGRGVADRLARIGYKPMHEKDVMDVLEKAILCSSPQFPSPPAAVVTGINTSPGAHWTEANWIQEQRFVGLKYRQVLHADQSFVSSHKKGPDGVRAQLSRVTSHDEAISIVLKAMTEKLMRMFGLAEDDMSSSKNLAGVGVDSLVAIELRNWITSEIHVDVSIFELMNGNTIAGLVELVVAKCS